MCVVEEAVGFGEAVPPQQEQNEITESESKVTNPHTKQKND